jgi:hypothetical protein
MLQISEIAENRQIDNETLDDNDEIKECLLNFLNLKIAIPNY